MAASSWILGLANNMHNGAACLVHGEKVVVAIQEERLTRIKRCGLDYNNSFLSVRHCLKVAGIQAKDISLVVESTSEKIESNFYGSNLNDFLGTIPHERISHHLAHAYSCGLPSGFQSATIAVIDGGGSPVTDLSKEERLKINNNDFCDTGYEHLSIYAYEQGQIQPVTKYVSHMPYLKDLFALLGKGMPEFASLGHMFSSVAFLLFGNYLDAGKVMGLAPYGVPSIEPEAFVRFNGIDLEFQNDVPVKFLGYEPWPQKSKELANLAASVQNALEYTQSQIFKEVIASDLPRNLAYCGGVALNSVANRKLLPRFFDDYFILPAADDSGTAIGAAYYGLSKLKPNAKPRKLTTDFLGKKYSKLQIASSVKQFDCIIEQIKCEKPICEIAKSLYQGKVVAWYDGKSEFGPRALGHRSILCDPRLKEGKELLNSRVKFREAFRPFAPMVLAESVHDWFEIDSVRESMKFMLEVCPFKEHVDLPAVVHVDGTGRLQVIEENSLSSIYLLIKEFERLTEVPILVNTSLNVMGEPIVETPGDAIWTLLTTGIDLLYLQGQVLKKREGFDGLESIVAECTGYLQPNEGEKPIEMEVRSEEQLSDLENELLKRLRPDKPLGSLFVDHEFNLQFRTAFASLLRRDAIKLLGYSSNN